MFLRNLLTKDCAGPTNKPAICIMKNFIEFKFKRLILCEVRENKILKIWGEPQDSFN